jgi:hypothetical protein
MILRRLCVRFICICFSLYQQSSVSGINSAKCVTKLFMFPSFQVVSSSTSYSSLPAVFFVYQQLLNLFLCPLDSVMTTCLNCFLLLSVQGWATFNVTGHCPSSFSCTIRDRPTLILLRHCFSPIFFSDFIFQRVI